jgi:hypothetical protein
MNLDSVTVGHVITVDFGPDRRSSVCKAWHWLQEKQPDYGIHYFSFSTAGNHLQKEKELPDFDTDAVDDFRLGGGYMNGVAGWFCLALAVALFVAIDVYAGG